MTTLGLLFGSFDPVHNGHLQIAHWALGEGCDEVWLVVQAENAYKPQAAVASLEHRTVMAALAVANRFKISVITADAGITPAHVVTKTVYELSTDNSIRLIMGEDLAAGFNEWPDHDLIVDRCKPLVHPRFDHTSSSEIRNTLGAGKNVGDQLTADVAEYIELNGLYGE